MKTIDELLIGTKYEGASKGPWRNAGYKDDEMRLEMGEDPMKAPYWCGWVAVDERDAQLIGDAKTNAALASLLPAAVKALEEIAACKGVPLGEEGHSMVTWHAHLANTALSAISEATKAVEGN